MEQNYMYLAHKYAQLKLQPCMWKKEVKEKDWRYRPSQLTTTINYIMFDNVAIDALCTLVEAGLTADEILVVLWRTADYAAGELKKYDQINDEEIEVEA